MKYVIIGSSAAGIHAIRELKTVDPDSRIVLVSKDDTIYSRCILHHYLSGIRTVDQLCFVEPDFIERYQVEWKKGVSCIRVLPEKKLISLSDGSTESYDKLLIAAGSHTFIPPVTNLKEAKNVCGFRNLEDIEVLKQVAKTRRNIVVMGSGLIGMDCACGFLNMGVKVTLVEMTGWLLSRQLDARAARPYQELFEEKGVGQYYGVGIREAVLNEDQEITELLLTDGRKLPCDYLVVTAGVRPNIEFLEGSGIQTDRFGLTYDETGRTSDEHIYGAGDISGKSPIWPIAVKEGIVAADNMAGFPGRMTDFFASKSTMNFMGIASMSLGEVNPPDDSYSVEIRDTGDTYKKIVHKDGKITGALLQGDLAYGGVLQQLISRKIDVRRVKKPIFDVDYSDFFHTKDNFEYDYE